MYTILMDTSNQQLMIGIADNHEILASEQIKALKQQSEIAIPHLGKLMEQVGIDFDQVDTMVITQGPGSYTGVRIAMTIAKTLAATMPIRLKAISSLEMLSYDKKAISLIDARGKKAYVGIYNHGEIVLEDCLMEVKDLPDLMNQYPDYEIAGDRFLVDLEEQEIDLCKALYGCSKHHDYVEYPSLLVPHYIKDVEVRKK